MNIQCLTPILSALLLVLPLGFGISAVMFDGWQDLATPALYDFDEPGRIKTGDATGSGGEVPPPPPPPPVPVMGYPDPDG